MAEKLSSSPFPIFELDLSHSLDSDSEIKTLLGKVKREKIYRPTNLYRGFDGSRVEIVQKYGTDRVGDSGIPQRDTFCFDEKIMLNPLKSYWARSPLCYALSFDDQAIVIYNGELMRMSYESYYFFEEGVNPLDAVLGVAKIK